MLKYHRVVQLGGIRVCFQAAVPIWSRMKCFYSVIWSRVGSVTNKNTQGTIKDFTRGTQRPASFLTYSPLQNYWSSKASSLILIIKTMNSAECLLSVLALCFASADCINKLNVYNVKTRELFIGEKLAILMLIEDWKSIRAIAQTLAIASTTIWNVLKKKETTGVLSRRRSTGRHRKQQLTTEKLWEIGFWLQKSTETRLINSGTKFYGLMRQRCLFPLQPIHALYFLT